MRARASAKVLAAAAASATLAGVTPALAQHSAMRPDPAASVFWWAGGTLVAAAAVSDAALERASLAHRSPTLDDLAGVGNALGAGRYLLPALGASYVAGRLAHQPRVADAALHATAAYALGNVVTSIGKPVLGRHRPDTTGSPWRFRPFARDGAWHSLPSGHVFHAFTLAGSISEEAHRPWVTVVAYGTATVVSWSRVYRDEHWASDVALSSVIGAAIGHAAVRALHGRGRSGRPHGDPTAARSTE